MGEEPINKMSSKLARRRLTHTLPKEERNPHYNFQNFDHYGDENDGESQMGVDSRQGKAWGRPRSARKGKICKREHSSERRLSSREEGCRFFSSWAELKGLTFLG